MDFAHALITSARPMTAHEHPKLGLVAPLPFVHFEGPLQEKEGDMYESRTATFVFPDVICRSPTGTGTAARLALLHRRGLRRKVRPSSRYPPEATPSWAELWKKPKWAPTRLFAARPRVESLLSVEPGFRSIRKTGPYHNTDSWSFWKRGADSCLDRKRKESGPSK